MSAVGALVAAPVFYARRGNMADTVTGQISLGAQWSWITPLGDGTTPKDIGTFPYAFTFLNGSGAGQISKVWHQTLPAIGSSSSQTLTLSALSNTIFGASVGVAFTSIKFLLIINSSTTTGEDLLIGGAGTHPWGGAGLLISSTTATISVPANGCLMAVAQGAGWAVTSSSVDQLKFANSGAANNTPTVLIMGN